MKVQIISDLHLEFHKRFPRIPPKEDILILAGDIGKINYPNFEPFLEYLSENWKLIIYVFGNHEFYHSSKTIYTLMEEYKLLFSKYPNIKLLEDDTYETEDYLFYGSLFLPKVSVPYTNCFKQIKEKNKKNWTVPISLETWNHLHQNYQISLKNRLNNLPDKKIIIITHYPLLINGTSHPKYLDDSLEKKENFAVDFDFGKVTHQITCIAGHTHYSYDFLTENGIRFISNQVGYIEEEIDFKEDLVFEI